MKNRLLIAALAAVLLPSVALADDKTNKELGNSILSRLQTLRSQFELYKIQHADNVPSLPQLADWYILLKTTTVNGVVPGKFGPYISEMPVNILNGKTKVVPTGRAAADAGWTYSFDNKGYYLRIVVPDEATMKALNLKPEDAEIIAK
jgi:hypothetical protein